MTMNRYKIQRLDGYTGGRESWLKVGFGWNKEEADAKADDLRKLYPKQKFRVRKYSRR